MYGIIRDSSFGQLVRLVTKNHYFQHVDEQPGFELLLPTRDDQEKIRESDSEQSTIADIRLDESDVEAKAEADGNRTVPGTEGHDGHSMTATVSRPIHPVLTSSGIILIDWYATGMESFQVSVAAC